MPTVLTPSLRRLIARTIEGARAAGRDQWSQHLLAAQKVVDIHHGLTVREATALVDDAQRQG